MFSYTSTSSSIGCIEKNTTALKKHKNVFLLDDSIGVIWDNYDR
jgi:hypothetical protein